MSAAVVTLAVGKPFYLSLAVNLARSFLHWHRQSDIRFAIATDRADLIPPDLESVEIIPLAPGQYGTGFSPKLHLDRFAPAARTLFVDSDCLCVGSLEPVFSRFRGRAVSVVGKEVVDGEWFGDVASVRARFGLPSLVKFNGGVYYIEKGAESSEVYSFARSLEPLYDEIGLVRLRDKPNEELLMAISLAKHGQRPVPEDGGILGDPQACPGPVRLDVLRGGSHLRNPPPPDPRHQAWFPLTDIHPVLVHFLADHTSRYPYRREARRLSLVLGRGWPLAAADLVAAVGTSAPLVAAERFKDIARPAYRRLFGTRPVRPSARV